MGRLDMNYTAKKPQEVNQCTKPGINVTRQYYTSKLCHSARTVVEFVCSLRTHHLQEFWPPCKYMWPEFFEAAVWLSTNHPWYLDSACHLPSAATVLLRCAIEEMD